MKSAPNEAVSLASFGFSIRCPELRSLCRLEALGNVAVIEAGDILASVSNPSLAPERAEGWNEELEVGSASSPDEPAINIRKRLARWVKIFFICGRAQKSVGRA